MAKRRDFQRLKAKELAERSIRQEREEELARKRAELKHPPPNPGKPHLFWSESLGRMILARDGIQKI